MQSALAHLPTQRGAPAPARALSSRRRIWSAPRASGKADSAASNGRSSSGAPTQLRLFLDSSAGPALELWLATGLFHGMTCNPIILQRDGVKCTVSSLSTLARQAFDLGAKEVHLQAWGSSVAQLSSTAFDLAGIDPQRVVVKLPCTLEGIQTAGLLRDSNVRVNVTALYTTHQVLVAQAVGADYAAPYLGRMNDAYGNEQGFEQISDMQKILQNNQSHLRLMVASVRDTADMTRLAARGCNTFTFSPTIASKLFNNPLTIDATGEFELAASSNGGNEDIERGVKSLPLSDLRKA